ncbi:radical SAM protein [Thiotrichales bacterium 19S3-7]|nr:radical SAM protein [Thiotrichales bacterium 19S3-7]MCF6803042.1 radical SAM protein [Thiotrichales bacterium 19S3-11]
MNNSSIKSATADDDWYDWRWQQRNTYKDEVSLRSALGGYSSQLSQCITDNLKDRKLQITPYYLDLILQTITDADDLLDNPLLRQVVPFWPEESSEGYKQDIENWELEEDMKTPICQHKYDNRVILRMSNTCNAYCQFCFEALRTLKTDTYKSTASKSYFEESLEYIKNTDGIEEVILSGGDPLVLSNKKLEHYLARIREYSDEILIRIHSRALTFNPYRVTDEFIDILEKYKVNSFGVHICHPSEISADFKTAIKKIQKAVPIVFSNMPFIRGINDNEETLHKLFIDLYKIGVKPYYLYHYMPFSPGSCVYKPSIKDGIRIMNRLKRRVSNIAMPEYVLPHQKGKYSVPLIEHESEVPYFEVAADGKLYYTFTNWKKEKCTWDDQPVKYDNQLLHQLLGSIENEH